MTRGVPCKVHQLENKTFIVIISISGEALSVDIPYTVKEISKDNIEVSSDDTTYNVKKTNSVVSVIAMDVRNERSKMLKFTKR